MHAAAGTTVKFEQPPPRVRLADGAEAPDGSPDGNGHPSVPLGLGDRALAIARVAAPRAGVAARAELLAGAFAVLLGCATTLYVGGYSFGEKNQSVYLLGGLHAADPSFLARDWLLSNTTFFHS